MKLKSKKWITISGNGIEPLVEIEISNDEVLAQLSEKERYNLASKLLIKPTKERE